TFSQDLSGLSPRVGELGLVLLQEAGGLFLQVRRLVEGGLDPLLARLHNPENRAPGEAPEDRERRQEDHRRPDRQPGVDVEDASALLGRAKRSRMAREECERRRNVAHAYHRRFSSSITVERERDEPAG